MVYFIQASINQHFERGFSVGNYISLAVFLVMCLACFVLWKAKKPIGAMVGVLLFVVWSYFVVSYRGPLSFSVLGQEVTWNTAADAIVTGTIVLGIFLAVNLSSLLGDIFRLRRHLSSIEQG